MTSTIAVSCQHSQEKLRLPTVLQDLGDYRHVCHVERKASGKKYLKVVQNLFQLSLVSAFEFEVKHIAFKPGGPKVVSDSNFERSHS